MAHTDTPLTKEEIIELEEDLQRHVEWATQNLTEMFDDIDQNYVEDINRDLEIIRLKEEQLGIDIHHSDFEEIQRQWLRLKKAFREAKQEIERWT